MLTNQYSKFDSSSGAQLWILWCSLTEALYSFNVSLERLYLKCLQHVFVKKECWFLVTQTCIGELTFIEFGLKKKTSVAYYQNSICYF